MKTLNAKHPLATDTRGATMAEYTLILCLVLVATAPLFHRLGRKAAARFQLATSSFDPRRLDETR